MKKAWTDTEISLLKKYVAEAEKSGKNQLVYSADKLERSVSAVRSKMIREGIKADRLSRNKSWTMRELKLLTEYAQTALVLDKDPVEYCAKMLGRSTGSVKSKMLKMRISTGSVEYQKNVSLDYQAAEIVMFKSLCPSCGRHYLIRGDLGYPHGVCEPCWIKARANAMERGQSIKDAVRYENRVKKRKQRAREHKETNK